MGHIVADFIDTGILTADIIKTGILESKNGKSWLNMSTGEFNFGDKVKYENGKFEIIVESSDGGNTSLGNELNNMDNKIDSIQVGGRNLLPRARTFENWQGVGQNGVKVVKDGFKPGMNSLKFAQGEEAIVDNELQRKALKNLANTHMIVTNPEDSAYSLYPNPPKGSTFNSVNRDGSLRKGEISSNGSCWAIISAYKYYTEVPTSSAIEQKLLQIMKDCADFMCDNLSVGRFNSMNFEFIDTSYKYSSETRVGWTVGTYKELYLSTMFLQVKSLTYAYKIHKNQRYLDTAYKVLDSLYNVQIYIKDKVAKGDLPTEADGAFYEYLACDNLSSSNRFSGSTKILPLGMGYYISQAVDTLIEIVGDNERTTAKGDSYRPSTIKTEYTKFLSSMIKTGNLTAKPTNLPYGHYYKSEDGTFKLGNWNFIDNAFGDEWFVGDVVCYTIIGLASLGFKTEAKQYMNAYYSLKVPNSSGRFTGDTVFYDRIDFSTGTHLPDDDSVSITYTALYMEMGVILKEMTHVENCANTLLKWQVSEPNNIKVDGAYMWDISKDTSSLELKSYGEIVNSEFFKYLSPQKIRNRATTASVSTALTSNITGKEFALSGWLKASDWNALASGLNACLKIGGKTYASLKLSDVIKNNNWTRFELLGSVEKEDEILTFELINNTSTTVEVAVLKLEKGNKITDFTDAPEDVEDNIVTSKNDAISSANNTLATTIANYYTKTQTDSQINIAKEAINLGVSSTYETKTEVTNKINGIKIGGRNLIKKKSEFMYGYIGQSNGSLNNTGSSLNSNQDFYTNEYFPLKTGESVCFTSYPKQTVNSSIKSAVYIHVYNSSKVWQKAIYHDTNTANATVNKIYTATEDCYVRFCSRGFNDYNHMAEYATKPSQWSPAPEDVETTVSTIEQRVSAAESKITDTAITNVVKQNFYTKSETDGQITSKDYQTASQVQQTVNNLQLKFTQSGGYNLFSNSGFKKGTSHWSTHTHNSPTGGSIETLTSSATWGFPDSTVNCVQIRLSNQSGKEYGITQAVKTTIGKKYTLSFYYAGHRLNQINAIVRNSSGGWLANKHVNTLPNGGNTNVGNWNKYNLTFTANATSHNINIVIVSAANDGYLWVAKPMVVEGELDLPYSPNPNEMYDGITTIDKDGVTVTSSNVNSKTKMSADGFQLIRTTDNKKMFYVNQDGSLEMLGNFTQYDKNGKMSIKISNNSYNCYDWLWDGDYVGKLGAFDTNRTSTSGTNTRFIGLSAVADYGNQLAFGVRSDTTSSKFKAYLEIDNTGSMHRDYVTLVANTGFKTNAIFRNGSNNNNETGRIFGATNDHFCVASNYHNQLRFCYEKNGDYHTAMSVYRNDNTSAGCAIEYYADEVHHKNVTISGFLSVRGQKNRLVATENFGDRLLNAYETAECYFGDINETIIGEDGEVKVELDEVFLETVNTTEPYQVFLTKYGEGDCYVSERHEKYFIIKGTPSLSVGFEVKAKQRGYEKERLKMTVNTLKTHQAESLENKAGEVIDCEIADNRG